MTSEAADAGVPGEVRGYALAMPVRFRGLTQRQGLLWRGPAGWAEWSPFLDYAGAELVPWLRAADEAADQGWPAPVRDRGAGQLHGAGGRARAGARDRRRLRLRHGQGQGRRARPDARRRPRALRGGARRARARTAGSGSTPTAAGTSTRPNVAVRALDRFDLEYVEQPCAASRTWPRSGSGWPGPAVRCRSPPTSPSAGPRTPTGSSPSTRPTSRCSRWRRSAGCAPPSRWPSGSGCPWSCRAPSRPRSAWRPGWRWPPRCPSCRTRAGWAPSGCSPTTSSTEPLRPVGGMLPVRAVMVDEDGWPRTAMTRGRAAWRERLAQTRALDVGGGPVADAAALARHAGRRAARPAACARSSSRPARAALRWPWCCGRPTGRAAPAARPGRRAGGRVPRARAGQGVGPAGRGRHHVGHRRGQPAPRRPRGLAQPRPAGRGERRPPGRAALDRRQPDHPPAGAVHPPRPRERDARPRRGRAPRTRSAACSPPRPASGAGCPGPVHLDVELADPLVPDPAADRAPGPRSC